MPTPAEILDGLATISNEMRALAILWHVVVGIAAVAIALGWRPSRRTSAVVLTLPLLSVAVLAWVHHNPFNGTVFLVFVVVLAAGGLRLPNAAVTCGPAWSCVVGASMVLFGLLYPHFVTAESWLGYIVAAPTGLVPCPTLSLIIGIALLGDGLGSRPWSVTLAAAGMFYGLFGTLRLGVHLDVGLIAGATALLVLGISRQASEQAHPTTG